MNKRSRDYQVKFYVTTEELKLINKRVKELGFRERSAYLRKVAIDTNILQLDLFPMSNLALSVDRIGININQIARVANSEKTISQKSINSLLEMLDEIHRETTSIYRKLLNVQRGNWWEEED